MVAADFLLVVGPFSVFLGFIFLKGSILLGSTIVSRPS